MPIASGTRLGPYEVAAPLGAGGMGEVYRARDTRLERSVAIKVLPAHLSQNPHLRQRFEREARALSSLSHPHICTLFDVGQENGVDFLVMEYLEGETLAARLEKGPLPPEQVLRYGVEIADALDKAHRQGVVHRDLKPGNIMLTKGGIKLLDFGLAKAATNVVASALTEMSKSPTQAQPLTAEGTFVGTFHYMAPEQLEGKEADARSDIFALGAVLYEMATGRKAFQGASRASVIAAILSSDPPQMTTLQPLTPPALDRLVRTCLAKDPDERWQTAHDLLLNLKWIAEAGSQAGVPAPVVARRKLRTQLVWAVAALAVLVAGGATVAAVRYARQAREAWRAFRSTFLPPGQPTFLGYMMAVSPDGRRMVFAARGTDGRLQLWLRPLDALTAQPLPGTEEAGHPFWSPDSRFIGFFAGGKLKKIDASGGPPQTLCSVTDNRGGTWSKDGVIVFAPSPSGPLYRVPAAGGEPTPVTKLDPARQEATHRYPWFLPDGRHFLYLARGSPTGPAQENNAVYVGSLDGKEPKLLVRADSSMAYAPPRYGQPGYLLYVREGTLLAHPFDAEKLELTGEAFPIAEQVFFWTPAGHADFDLSANGVLAYQSAAGSASAKLVWFDRAGKQIGAVGDPGLYGAPHLSPDGKRLAVGLFDTQAQNTDIWLFELARGVRTRFTFDPGVESFPIWSPDGSRIVFGCTRKGIYDICLKSSSGAGAEEVLLATEAVERPTSWSPDGRFIAYMRDHPQENTEDDIWVLPLAGDPSAPLGAGRKPFPFLQTPFDEDFPAFSPDGRWIAYESSESGQDQIYLMPFRVTPKGEPLPAAGGKWQVSTTGGLRPLWRRDGKELFYLTLDGKLMAVEVNLTGSSPRVGVPRMLFGSRATPAGLWCDASADGQRFLVYTAGEAGSANPITLVVNWPADLKKK